MIEEINKLNDLTKDIKDNMILVKNSGNTTATFSFINYNGSVFTGDFTRLFHYNSSVPDLLNIYYYVKPYNKNKSLYVINIGTIDNYKSLSPEEISKLGLDK